MKNQGVTILEMIIVLMIMGAGSFVIRQGVSPIINQAKLSSTLKTMNSIAKASINYHQTENVWPVSLDDLYPVYLPQKVGLNPFKENYSFQTHNDRITVSSHIPQDIPVSPKEASQVSFEEAATSTKINLTKYPSLLIAGRLKYEKKYFFNE